MFTGFKGVRFRKFNNIHNEDEPRYYNLYKVPCRHRVPCLHLWALPGIFSNVAVTLLSGKFSYFDIL